MKLKIARGAAVLSLAAAAALAFPVAASASVDYPPTPTTPPSSEPTPTATETTAPTPGPGAVVPLSTPAGIFAANEAVTVLLSGEDANFARAAIVQAAYVSSANIGTVTSSANGSVSFAVTLPDTASGTYSATLVSDSRPQGYNLTFAADGSVISGGASGSGSGSLPATGMDSGSLLGLWAGGGALVLAGGAVAVGAAVHRQRKNADA